MAEIGYTRLTYGRYRVPLEHTFQQRLRTTLFNPVYVFLLVSSLHTHGQTLKGCRQCWGSPSEPPCVANTHLMVTLHLILGCDGPSSIHLPSCPAVVLPPVTCEYLQVLSRAALPKRLLYCLVFPTPVVNKKHDCRYRKGLAVREARELDGKYR